MATHVLTTFHTFKQAGSYAGISAHWEIVDPTITDPYPLAADLLGALFAPVAGDAYYTTLLECLAEDTFVKTARARVVSPPNANNAVVFFQDGDLVGVFGPTTDALNVAACIIWLTSGNDGLTGRQFLPGIAETAYANGRATSTLISDINDHVANVVSGFQGTAGTFFPVVKHGDPAAYARITQGYLSATPGTQKRRRVPW